jgi:hypothetical protein
MIRIVGGVADDADVGDHQRIGCDVVAVDALTEATQITDVIGRNAGRRSG